MFGNIFVSAAKEKYTCEMCGKSYVRAWSYYEHIREHLLSDNKCTICGKQFDTASALKDHTVGHSGK